MFGNAYVLLLIATIGWAGNAVAGKFAASGWEPFTLTCLRWFLVVIVVLPFAWRHLLNDRKLIAQKWWYFLGVLGFCMALFNLLMFLALNYTSAINVSIEQAFMPVLIILANFVLLSQRVRLLQIIGVVLSILGVWVTSTQGNPLLIFDGGLNRGDAIMLLACVFYAAYTFSLKWKPAVHWLSFMCLIALGAFLVSIPFALYAINTNDLEIPATADWLVLIYIVLVPSIVSQLAFAKSVALIGGNRAGLFINLVPIFGSMLAVLLLSEQFKLFHAIGMVLVIGGILLAERIALANDRANTL